MVRSTIIVIVCMLAATGVGLMLALQTSMKEEVPEVVKEEVVAESGLVKESLEEDPADEKMLVRQSTPTATTSTELVAQNNDTQEYAISASYLQTHNPFSRRFYPELPFDVVDTRPLNATYTLLRIEQPHPTDVPHWRYFLYDVHADRVVREYERGFSYQEVWFQPQLEKPFVRVGVERDALGRDQIVFYDYVQNIAEVLYTEIDPSVQLAEVCELGGCIGILQATLSDSVIVGRYKKGTSTTLARFMEAIEVPLPNAHSSN